MQKRFHIHKEQGPFSLLIYISSIVCFYWSLLKNNAQSCLDICSQKQCSYRGKIQKTVKQSWVHAQVIWPIHCFHIKNIKFKCLYLLLKHEKGKIFRKIRILYLIEFFIVIIVTDRKWSVADNVVLAIFGTDRHEQTVQTLIAGLGLHCLPFHLPLLDTFLYAKTTLIKF